jgi:hypothetical protein
MSSHCVLQLLHTHTCVSTQYDSSGHSKPLSMGSKPSSQPNLSPEVVVDMSAVLPEAVQCLASA